MPPIHLPPLHRDRFFAFGGALLPWEQRLLLPMVTCVAAGQASFAVQTSAEARDTASVVVQVAAEAVPDRCAEAVSGALH